MLGVLACVWCHTRNRTKTGRARPSAAVAGLPPAAVARRVGSRCSPNLPGGHPRPSSLTPERQLRWCWVQLNVLPRMHLHCAKGAFRFCADAIALGMDICSLGNLEVRDINTERYMTSKNAWQLVRCAPFVDCIR